MIVRAENLSKSYSNGEKVLSVFSGIFLNISKGDFVTIMGPSGAGKSTLLNILGTLDTSDTGRLEIDGNDISQLYPNTLADLRNKTLGFVFQFHHLLPEFSALENILMPAFIRRDSDAHNRAVELLEYVGLSNRKDHFPAQLSGGERSRIAVLRALIKKPTLILADEPTGNLDKGNADKLMKLLLKINGDFEQAVVLTTHNPDVANLGTKQLVLENGHLETRID